MRGAVRLRASIPGGSVFLVEGAEDQPANVLTEPLVEVRPVGRAEQSAAAAAIVTPAGEGHAEPPASAPLDIPPTDPHAEGGAA